MSQGSRRETLRQQIDENLRRVYQQKIEEGIPDRFAQLLSQLRGGAAGEAVATGPAGDGALNPGTSDRKDAIE